MTVAALLAPILLVVLRRRWALVPAALWLAALVVDDEAVAPVGVATWLLVASATWPDRRVPRILTAAAGAVAVGGLWLAVDRGDLSDVATALGVAAVLAAAAAWTERDGGVAPAALALLGAATVAAGLARLEATTGGFALGTGRHLEPGPGWAMALGAAAVVVAAAWRPRRAGVVLLPLGLWVGVLAGAALEHGGDAIAIALGAVAVIAAAKRPHLALALWALAAAAVPVDGLAAASLVAAAAVVAATTLHPHAALAAAPGAAALAIALADDGSPARLALAGLALLTVGRVWRPDADDAEVVEGAPDVGSAAGLALGAWLLLAPETWAWVGDPNLLGWGTGVLLAAVAGAVGAYVAVSVRGQDVVLPNVHVPDPAYLPGERRRARLALVAGMAILGICGGWLLASSLQ